MNNGDEMVGEGGADVVRLKVGGAAAAVNTLRDQQTARGMSLVCPFPALEVEIPVQFGKAEGAMTQGTIHRIGVEDDPQSGLPRLRLSVRTRDTRSTVVVQPPKSLLDEASRVTRAADANAETALDVLSETGFERVCLDDIVEETSLQLGEVRHGEIIESDVAEGASRAADPEWAACGEIALPERLSERERTRRRRRLSSFAAWAFIFGIAAGGVYVLGKAKVVDFGSMRDAIAGFDMSQQTTPSEVRLDTIAFVDSSAGGSVSAVAGAPVGASTGWETHVDVAETAAPAAPAVDVAEEPPTADMVAPDSQQAATAEAAGPAAGEEEDTIVLPTRWPAEYANAYRLRNPNGVVVDIPGALVAREGWLEVGEHKMVRSVKAMQRETGARFVVYINGELPRFMTAPKTNGIALKLVRDTAAPSTQTQQVAALEK
jgi:hypothetical protein